VFIATSVNNGVAFGAPVRIDSATGTSFQVMPTAAIDPTTGCIAVHYYDNRNGGMNAAGRFLLDVFATRSRDGGMTFAPDFQFNDAAFDPNPGAGCRLGPPPCGNQTNPPTMSMTTRIGEYNGVAVGGGTASAVWTGDTLDAFGTANGQQITFARFACNSADLSISKAGAPDPVTTGGQLTYTIVVTNKGPDPAMGVVVTDTLPPGVTFDSDTDACVEAPVG